MRLILMKGGVETLTFFANEIGKFFIDKGFKIFWYDLEDSKSSLKHLKKFIKPNETALLTFNFLGVSGEDGLFDEDRGYIWELYDIPIFNIVVDHPLYYTERYEFLPPRYYQFHIDKDHERYYLKYYPKLKSGGFLPLAGTSLDFKLSDIDEHFKGRDIDCLFAGTYMNPDEYMKYITRINDEYTAFYLGIVDDMYANPMRSLTDVAHEHCLREMGEMSIEDWRTCYQCLNFIDLYVRAIGRERVIKALVNNGIKVDIFGHRWDELKGADIDNMVFHGPVDSKTCLEYMKRAKISLNVLPWFREGAHDRVFNAMANGSICLTDRSTYLDDIFVDDEDYKVYDINDLDGLVDKYKSLINDKDKMYDMAVNAYHKAVNGHLWSDRAEVLYEFIMSHI